MIYCKCLESELHSKKRQLCLRKYSTHDGWMDCQAVFTKVVFLCKLRR